MEETIDKLRDTIRRLRAGARRTHLFAMISQLDATEATPEQITTAVANFKGRYDTETEDLCLMEDAP